jgi:hypothetical protein
MMSNHDEIVAVCLQSACIRAAAVMLQDLRTDEWTDEDVRGIDMVARLLYFQATATPWERGDEK